MHNFIQNELEVTRRAKQKTAGPSYPMNLIEQKTTKTCVGCGQDRPLSDFLRRSGRGTGAGARRGTCRSCRTVRQAMLETAASMLPAASVLPHAGDTDAAANADPASDGQAPKAERKRKRRRTGKRGDAVRMAAESAEAAVIPKEHAPAAAEPQPETEAAPLEEKPPKRKRSRRRKKGSAAAAPETVASSAEPTAGSDRKEAEPADDARTASAAQHGSVTPEDGQDTNDTEQAEERKPGKRKRTRRRKSKAAKAAALAAMEEAAAAALPATPAPLEPPASHLQQAQPVPVAAPAADELPFESKSARKRRLKMLANGYGTPVFVLPAHFLPLPPEQFEEDEEPEPASPAAEGGAGDESSPLPKRKRKRSRRRKSKLAEPAVEAAPRLITRRPLPLPPPGSIASDGSELRPTRQGIIRMRGRTDKGRRWQQETDLETALALVREHAAVVVNHFTIRRLFTSRAFRMYILDRDQYTCHFCGQYGDTIDHLRPRAKGGHTTPLNCVCACSLCNQSKADRDLDEFVGE